jgi:uncharacterized protein
MNTPVELPYPKCAELLESQVVGRVAVCTPEGPRIVPVNYSVVGETIVFRTTPYSILGTYAWTTELAFEVDHLDVGHRSGWSVVAIGRGTLIEDPEELARIRSFWDPDPWAGGHRMLYVGLKWRDLTGRRLGSVAVTETPSGAHARS